MPRGAGCALTPPTECCRFDYLSDLSHEDDPATTLERIQQSFVIADPSLPDCPIVFASDGFLDFTGYTREEILGRNCRFLQGGAGCRSNSV